MVFLGYNQTSRLHHFRLLRPKNIFHNILALVQLQVYHQQHINHLLLHYLILLSFVHQNCPQHIYRLFRPKKLEKQDFSKIQFFPATGDILEMQQGIFMNWCDSNTRATKKDKMTGHRSVPPSWGAGRWPFFVPMVLMLLLLRLCVIPWRYR